MNKFDNKKLYKLAPKILLGFLGTSVVLIKPCLAQSNIVKDDTLGSEASKITPNVDVDGIPSELIEGGAERGQNLFHSLQKFNVGEGRGAYFVVPSDKIQNVLTRVTGNNLSNILGTLGIRQRVGGDFVGSEANLFLINPNGILFGENARLDVGGSFVGTTANGVQFGERGVFSATNPQAPSKLLTVNPSAFLFSQINAQATIKNSSIAPAETDLTGSERFGLRVPDDKSLLLVGGNISIDGGQLNALGGKVELGGLLEPGNINLDVDGDDLSLGFSENVARADILLTNGAGIYVESNSGGDIVVNAQNLEMTRQSFFNAGIGHGLGSNNSNAGNIDINATGIVALSNSYIVNDVQAEAKGQGGDVNISANTLKVEDEAKVSAGTDGKGKGGNLTVNAQDVQLIGEGKDGGISSGLFTQAGSNSIGDAGNLTLSTNKLLVQDGAIVDTGTFGEGKGGDLTVNAQDVQLIGTTEDGSSGGLYTRTNRNSTGDAGNLTLSTNKLLVQDGARVNTGTLSKGNGGDLTVDAQDVQVIGESENGWFSSSLFAAANTKRPTGDAGNLTISTNKLLVQDGALVVTGAINSKGGILTINADTLQLDDATITAQSGSGSAGNIEINVKDNFNADNGQVTTQSNQLSGGNIKIAGKNIILRNNSNIKTTLSTTAGSGGNITLIGNAIVALEDSDILAFAPEGTGGNINFDTDAFLSDSLYRPRPQNAVPLTAEELNQLDDNNRVDVDATGSISSGTISGQTDPSFLQNSLTELPQNQIDSKALIATSCVVRSKERNGTFFITGKTNLPYAPQNAVPSNYSAIKVQPLPDDTSAKKPRRRWKMGDPIVEPSGVYRLENGRRVLSRECSK